VVRKVSNSDNNSPKPASDVNMSLPYAEQMAPLADALRAFMQGSGGHFMSMHDLSGDWPEHSKTEQVTPRSGVTAAVKRFIATARGAAKYASDLPSKPSVAGCVASLEQTYTVTRGDNKGNIRSLVMNACGAARRAHKIEARRVKRSLGIMKAQDEGGAWYAQGVNDKDGNPIPYPSESKARKAGARLEHGGDWWATDKADRLQAVSVRRGLPTSAVVYAEMSAAKAIALAKQKGAPSDVTTGKGAGDRSRNWLTDNQV
jgi:hypothetical protein